MRQAALVHAAPKEPSPVAPPARRPQRRRLVSSRAAGFDSPEEGTARKPPPLSAAPLPSPPPSETDSRVTPTAQVSMQPARQPQDRGCACSPNNTFTSVTPFLPTKSKLWGHCYLHKVFPCSCIALITCLPQALWMVPMDVQPHRCQPTPSYPAVAEPCGQFPYRHARPSDPHLL